MAHVRGLLSQKIKIQIKYLLMTRSCHKWTTTLLKIVAYRNQAKMKRMRKIVSKRMKENLCAALVAIQDQVIALMKNKTHFRKMTISNKKCMMNFRNITIITILLMRSLESKTTGTKRFGTYTMTATSMQSMFF